MPLPWSIAGWNWPSNTGFDNRAFLTKTGLSNRSYPNEVSAGITSRTPAGGDACPGKRGRMKYGLRVAKAMLLTVNLADQRILISE